FPSSGRWRYWPDFMAAARSSTASSSSRVRSGMVRRSRLFGRSAMKLGTVARWGRYTFLRPGQRYHGSGGETTRFGTDFACRADIWKTGRSRAAGRAGPWRAAHDALAGQFAPTEPLGPVGAVQKR